MRRCVVSLTMETYQEEKDAEGYWPPSRLLFKCQLACATDFTVVDLLNLKGICLREVVARSLVVLHSCLEALRFCS